MTSMKFVPFAVICLAIVAQTGASSPDGQIDPDKTGGAQFSRPAADQWRASSVPQVQSAASSRPGAASPSPTQSKKSTSKKSESKDSETTTLNESSANTSKSKKATTTEKSDSDKTGGPQGSAKPTATPGHDR
jgi:hypothetical protein